MSELDFPAPDRFTTGTVGPPGQRVFYLQVGEGTRMATFRLEKQQVTALADSLENLLTDLADPPEATAAPADLVEPLVPEWVVGAMGVGYDEVGDRILIAAQELGDPADADDATDAPDETPGLVPGLAEPDSPATARVFLTRAQAAAFVTRARTVVGAGRPPCPFCGRPLDPQGHACPRMN